MDAALALLSLTAALCAGAVFVWLLDVRAVFSWSYQALDAAAARVFRLLGAHPGPDISLPAAASLCALDDEQVSTRHALDELMRAHLLTEHAPGRYGFHDLLRAYASDIAHSHDNEANDATRCDGNATSICTPRTPPHSCSIRAGLRCGWIRPLPAP